MTFDAAMDVDTPPGIGKFGIVIARGQGTSFGAPTELGPVIGRLKLAASSM
jgi:hypothetical protein